MSIVTPIEPHIRRRDHGRQPKTVVERGVAIPLHREPLPAPKLVPEIVAEGALTERELAARFFPVAAVVLAADLVTKAWATTALADGAMRLSPTFGLALAYNPASAGGVWLGEHTRVLNFGATGVIVGLLLMLVPVLARVDRRAWVAVALIVGAGLGNMVSMAADARGVVDFIAVGRWVLNVADVALLVGLALLARTTVGIARSVVRGEGSARVGLR
jgi:signal peptidase II